MADRPPKEAYFSADWFDLSRNCTFLDPDDGYRWNNFDCDKLSELGEVYPVCEYANPSEDLHIEEETGKKSRNPWQDIRTLV